MSLPGASASSTEPLSPDTSEAPAVVVDLPVGDPAPIVENPIELVDPVDWDAPMDGHDTWDCPACGMG